MRESRNAASFTVSVQVLEQALSLPVDHHIIGASWDWACEGIRLYVEGPDLPEVKVGDVTPIVVPSITKFTDIDDKVKLHWNWNL